MPNEHDQNATGNVGVWDASDPGHAELVRMRIRMIALENIVLAILARSDDGVRQKIRERAAEIHPRDGAAAHPLTEHAGDEILRLLARSERRQD